MAPRPSPSKSRRSSSARRRRSRSRSPRPTRPTMKPMRVVFEQNGKQTPLFSLDAAGQGARSSRTGPTRSASRRTIGKQTIPDLQSGAARIIVTAGGRCCTACGTLESTRHADVQVRLERPRVVGDLDPPLHQPRRHPRWSSTARRPADVESGVRRRRHRVSGLSRRRRDSRRRQDHRPRGARSRSSRCSTTRTSTRRCASFARDEAGNTARADFDHRTFPKPFKKSRIELDDKFLDRVVPAILEGTTEVKPEGDDAREVPRRSTASCGARTPRRSRSFAKQTAPEMLWRGDRVPPVHEQRRRVGVRRPAHLHLQGQGSRPAGAPRLRPRVVRRHADRRREPRQGAVRRRARHLRQLRDHRSRHGRAVALRAPVVDRREGRAGRREGAGARPERHDRAGRRRSPALHDARQRPDGEPGRVVGRALDRGSDPAQAARSRRGPD